MAVEIDELMEQNDVPADVAMELNEKEENFLKQYEDLQKPEIPTSSADPLRDPRFLLVNPGLIQLQKRQVETNRSKQILSLPGPLLKEQNRLQQILL